VQSSPGEHEDEDELKKKAERGINVKFRDEEDSTQAMEKAAAEECWWSLRCYQRNADAKTRK